MEEKENSTDEFSSDDSLNEKNSFSTKVLSIFVFLEILVGLLVLTVGILEMFDFIFVVRVLGAFGVT